MTYPIAAASARAKGSSLPLGITRHSLASIDRSLGSHKPGHASRPPILLRKGHPGRRYIEIGACLHIRAVILPD